MATKSFLKNITIRNRRDCLNFVKALERSADAPKPSYDSKPRVKAKDMSKEQIAIIFGKEVNTPQ